MLCAFSSKFRDSTQYANTAFLGSAENPCKYTFFFPNTGSFFCKGEVNDFFPYKKFNLHTKNRKSTLL